VCCVEVIKKLNVFEAGENTIFEEKIFRTEFWEERRELKRRELQNWKRKLIRLTFHIFSFVHPDLIKFGDRIIIVFCLFV